MSTANRKRQYDKLVAAGRLEEITQRLKDEFDTKEKVQVAEKKIEKEKPIIAKRRR